MDYITAHQLKTERFWSSKAISHFLTGKKVAFPVDNAYKMGYAIKNIDDIEKSHTFLEIMAEYYVSLKNNQPDMAEKVKHLYFSKAQVKHQQIEKKSRAVALLVSLQELKKMQNCDVIETAIKLVEDQLRSLYPFGIPQLSDLVPDHKNVSAVPKQFLKKVV